MSRERHASPIQILNKIARDLVARYKFVLILQS